MNRETRIRPAVAVDALLTAPADSMTQGEFTGCPDCGNRQLSYRVFDHDTQCSYPLDDGEHFCAACDCVWLDEDVHEPLSGWALAEQSALRRVA